MTTANLNITPLADYSAPDLSSPGRVLAHARASRKLTVEDVAQRLKYHPRQIQALEADEYETLPGHAIVGGLVRNYARLLNLDPQPLVDQVKARIAPPPPSVLVHDMAVPFPERAPTAHRLYVALSVIIAAFVILFLIDWFLGARERIASAFSSVTRTAQSLFSSEPSSVAEPSPPVVARTPPPDPAPSSDASPPPPVVAAPAVLMPVNPTTLTASQPPASAAGRAKRIVLTFSRDSWVEVRDGNGQVLANELNRAGTQRSIEGTPPFNVVIGAASGVQLTYDDKRYDLGPVTQVDVARLTLE